jgi:hypothetical protein
MTPDDSRVKLTPIDQCVGEVGGTWWPRSRDLAHELPELLPTLADRLGRVERVVYDPAGWVPSPPERITTDDRPVALEAYPYESFDKLYVYGIGGASIVLQVIPDSGDLSARAMAAARSRWESEGGLLSAPTTVREQSG